MASMERRLKVGSARRAASRLLLALLLLPSLFLLSSPDAHVGDQAITYSRLQSSVGFRNKVLLAQVAAINKGQYLVGKRGRSMTQESPDDLGALLWQADLALVRRALGLGPMSPSGIYRIQSHVSVLAAGLLLLLGVSYFETFLFVVLLVLFAPSGIGNHDGRLWPQVISLALTFVLIDMATRRVADEPSQPPLRHFFAIALFTGWMGIFRAEAHYIALVPFLALFATNLAILVWNRPPRHPDRSSWRAGVTGLLSEARRWLTRNRSGESRRFPKWTVGLASPQLRAVLVSAVVIAGIFAASGVGTLNIALFEVIEDTEHQPEMGRHLFWHPLFLGLGAHHHHPENIYWHDFEGKIEAQKESGVFSGYTREYEQTIRHRYLDILTHNTSTVFQAYLRKARDLFAGQHAAVSGALPLAIIALLGLILLFSVQRSRGSSLAGGLNFALASVSVVAVAALPGIMTTLDYATALCPALTAASLFGAALTARTCAADPPPECGDDRYWLWFRRVTIVIPVASAIVLAAVGIRSASIRAHREQLSQQLAGGSLSYSQLLDEYHADAVTAFNSLSRAEREKLTREISGHLPPRLDPKVRLVPGTPTSLVVDARWRNDHLYLLVRLKERLTGLNVIPVQLGYESEDAIHLNDLIFLPPRIESGPWLLSMRAPRNHVRDIAIGRIAHYHGSLYIKRLGGPGSK